MQLLRCSGCSAAGPQGLPAQRQDIMASLYSCTLSVLPCTLARTVVEGPWLSATSWQVYKLGTWFQNKHLLWLCTLDVNAQGISACVEQYCGQRAQCLDCFATCSLVSCASCRKLSCSRRHSFGAAVPAVADTVCQTAVAESHPGTQ